MSSTSPAAVNIQATSPATTGPPVTRGAAGGTISASALTTRSDARGIPRRMAAAYSCRRRLQRSAATWLQRYGDPQDQIDERPGKRGRQNRDDHVEHAHARRAPADRL